MPDNKQQHSRTITVVTGHSGAVAHDYTCYWSTVIFFYTVMISSRTMLPACFPQWNAPMNPSFPTTAAAVACVTCLATLLI